MGIYKKERKMKVYAQSGYRYKETATIILKEDWLNDLGLEQGTPIRVECESGRLVITKENEAIMD
jgi:formylmethanofuran dehydrogenase subunit D